MRHRFLSACLVAALSVGLYACSPSAELRQDTGKNRSTPVKWTLGPSISGRAPTKNGWYCAGTWQPRYGADGRGIYFVAEWRLEDEDALQQDVIFMASIDATPVAVAGRGSDVPDAVLEELLLPPDDSAMVLATSEDGMIRVDVPREETSGAAVDLVDVRTGVTRRLTVGARGAVPFAAWLGPNRLLLSVDTYGDGAKFMLVDTVSLKTLRTFEAGFDDVTGIAAGPPGYFLVSGESDDDSMESPLWIGDARSGALQSIGTVRVEGWDFSPSRSTLLLGSEGFVSERTLDPSS